MFGNAGFCRDCARFITFSNAQTNIQKEVFIENAVNTSWYKQGSN